MSPARGGKAQRSRSTRRGASPRCSSRPPAPRPATCWRTARARAWRIPSWRRWRTAWPSAASPRCATSSTTWSRARSGPTRRSSRTRRCAPPIAEAGRRLPKLPLIAGGKSFGGRMTSQAQAERPLPGVKGLAFLGFPLHPVGKPSDERAAHLAEVKIPMLFLQGTRDDLATLDLLKPLVAASRQARDAKTVRERRSLVPRPGPLRTEGCGDARTNCSMRSPNGRGRGARRGAEIGPRAALMRRGI